MNITNIVNIVLINFEFSDKFCQAVLFNNVGTNTSIYLVNLDYTASSLKVTA